MAQPQPATLNLVDDGTTDRRLRWYRHYEVEIKITSDGATGINLASLYSTYEVQIRKKDSDETLVATGTVNYVTASGNGSGTDGWLKVTFPSTTLSTTVAQGWSSTGEADATCRWDLVGVTSGSNRYQLVEGDADTLRSTTAV